MHDRERQRHMRTHSHSLNEVRGWRSSYGTTTLFCLAYSKYGCGAVVVVAGPLLYGSVDNANGQSWWEGCSVFRGAPKRQELNEDRSR